MPLNTGDAGGIVRIVSEMVKNEVKLLFMDWKMCMKVRKSVHVSGS